MMPDDGLEQLRPHDSILFGAVGWMIWVARRRGETRHGFTAGLTLLLAAFLAILPATLRNYAVARDTVLISSKSMFILAAIRANSRFSFSSLILIRRRSNRHGLDRI